MLHAGAPRLLKAGVHLPGLHDGDPTRVALEGYPALLAREVLGRRSYKSDDKVKQTGDRLIAPQRPDHCVGARTNAPQAPDQTHSCAARQPGSRCQRGQPRCRSVSDAGGVGGEVRDAPKVELLPVTEATPQFKNFLVKNIVCDGAEKAVFIRGLPEMSIKNIAMENMVIKAKKGIICEEANGVSFKNVQILATDTKPLISILNGQNISFDKLMYTVNAELLFGLKGENTKNVIVTNTDPSKAKAKAEFTAGAAEKALSIK